MQSEWRGDLRERLLSSAAVPTRTYLATVCVAVSVLCACARPAPAGRLQYTSLPSESEGRTLSYGLYRPPGWDGTTPLPVVVLLHGAGDDETSADRIGVVDRLDAAIRDGTLPPFVLVAPEGERGFWVDWYDGSHRYASWVLRDVLADVRAKVPTVAGGLHLVGMSMGGGGGLQMWLAHRPEFASATILSAPIFDEADTREFLRRFTSKKAVEKVFGPPGSSAGIDPYRALASDDDREGTKLLFGAAKHDIGGIVHSNERFATHLRRAGVHHTFVVFPGKHRWTTWGAVLPWALCKQLRDDCPLETPKGWTVR